MGHGQSEGDRVHVNDIHEYVDDVFYHLDMVSERFPDIPKFIIGHSMVGVVYIKMKGQTNHCLRRNKKCLDYIIQFFILVSNGKICTQISFNLAKPVKYLKF